MRVLSTLLIAATVLTAPPAFGRQLAKMTDMNQPAVIKTGQGSGVITAIDPKAGKVTIKHGAIPALSWPAMTMEFRANPPTLLHGLRVGQRIVFVIKVQGNVSEVTGIRIK